MIVVCLFICFILMKAECLKIRHCCFQGNKNITNIISLADKKVTIAQNKNLYCFVLKTNFAVICILQNLLCFLWSILYYFCKSLHSSNIHLWSMFLSFSKDVILRLFNVQKDVLLTFRTLKSLNVQQTSFIDLLSLKRFSRIFFRISVQNISVQKMMTFITNFFFIRRHLV